MISEIIIVIIGVIIIICFIYILIKNNNKIKGAFITNLKIDNTKKYINLPRKSLREILNSNDDEKYIILEDYGEFKIINILKDKMNPNLFNPYISDYLFSIKNNSSTKNHIHIDYKSILYPYFKQDNKIGNIFDIFGNNANIILDEYINNYIIYKALIDTSIDNWKKLNIIYVWKCLSELMLVYKHNITFINFLNHGGYNTIFNVTINNKDLIFKSNGKNFGIKDYMKTQKFVNYINKENEKSNGKYVIDILDSSLNYKRIIAHKLYNQIPIWYIVPFLNPLKITLHNKKMMLSQLINKVNYLCKALYKNNLLYVDFKLDNFMISDDREIILTDFDFEYINATKLLLVHTYHINLTDYNISIKNLTVVYAFVFLYDICFNNNLIYDKSINLDNIYIKNEKLSEISQKNNLIKNIDDYIDFFLLNI